jgi:RNA polymerase sigma factor (sigma-70 family)
MGRQKESRGVDPRQLVPDRLVEQCKEGDERAWSELVEATHREVYTLCLRVLGDPEDAADATQDAYVRAWRGLAGFRGEAMFTTWLYRVAANAAISKHRGRKRRRAHEAGVDVETLAAVASPDSTEAAVDARLDAGTLEKALATLPDHYRLAVVLRDVYGMSIAEIAQRLRISESAAKVRVHRGRKKLKEMVFEKSGAGRNRNEM